MDFGYWAGRLLDCFTWLFDAIFLADGLKSFQPFFWFPVIWFGQSISDFSHHVDSIE